MKKVLFIAAFALVALTTAVTVSKASPCTGKYYPLNFDCTCEPDGCQKAECLCNGGPGGPM